MLKFIPNGVGGGPLGGPFGGPFGDPPMYVAPADVFEESFTRGCAGAFVGRFDSVVALVVVAGLVLGCAVLGVTCIGIICDVCTEFVLDSLSLELARALAPVA